MNTPRNVKTPQGWSGLTSRGKIDRYRLWFLAKVAGSPKPAAVVASQLGKGTAREVSTINTECHRIAKDIQRLAPLNENSFHSFMKFVDVTSDSAYPSDSAYLPD